MSQPFLTSGDICELTGLEAHVFNDWCVKDIVRPTEGGEGSGSHRKFDVMTAVGIVVAVRIYRSEHGCVLGYVKKVVAAFAGMREADLRAKFRQGKTNFMAEHQGKPFLGSRPPYEELGLTPNVRQILAEVRAKFAEREAEVRG